MRPEIQERKSVQPASELHSVALERHYSVPEIAELWAMSEKSVRRLFAGEHGVLEWGTHESARKRGYLNLRIPESVLIRYRKGNPSSRPPNCIPLLWKGTTPCLKLRSNGMQF